MSEVRNPWNASPSRDREILKEFFILKMINSSTRGLFFSSSLLVLMSMFQTHTMRYITSKEVDKDRDFSLSSSKVFLDLISF